MGDPSRFDDLAARVSDGEQIDWAAERRRATGPDEHKVLDQLASIHRLSVVIRDLSPPDGARDAVDPTVTAPYSAGELEGTAVGNYVIDALVGRGGMGDVYRARDERLGRMVAIKVLSTELASDEVARRRFLRETRLACRVSHPYVAAVYDVLEQDGRVFLVMEWIRGRRLDTLIADGPLPLERVGAYAAEIAEALRALHGADLIHRDLKPGNVIVTPDGHVKVMDFGVALHRLQGGRMATEPAEKLTGENRRVGTVAYMSPEQIRGEEVDERSDLFALGILIWEMLSGSHPFARPTGFETASAILKEPPGSGETLRPLACPPQLRQVVLKLLEKDPALRYPDAGSLLGDLKSGSFPEPVGRGATRAVRPRSWARVGALLVVVAIAAAVAARIAWRRGPTDAGGTGVPAVAVLPFLDRDGDLGASVRGEMVASLVLGGLFESRVVRPVDVERLQVLPEDADTDAATRASRVAEATGARWVVTGELWTEDDTLVGLARVYRPPARDPVATHPLRAAGTSGFAALAASRILDAVAPGKGGAETKITAETDSEEAREAVYRSRVALRAAEYGAAIGALESAVRIDPAYVAAHTALAESRHRAGYGKSARAAADKAVALATAAGKSIPERVVLEARAVHSLVFEQVEKEREARRVLVERYGADPGLLVAYADVCDRDGKYEEALGAVAQAEAIDPGDMRIPLMRARVHASMREYDQAVAALGRADTVLGPAAKPEARGGLALQRGQVEMKRQSYAAASEQYGRAEELFEEARLPVLSARARRAVLQNEVIQGKFPESDAVYDRLLQTFRSQGALQDLVNVLNEIGGRHFLAGEFRPAEPRLRAALEEGRVLENPPLLLYPKLNLAALLNYTGRSAEGGGLAAEALETARDYRIPDMQEQALSLLADAKMQQGHLEQAGAEWAKVVELARSGGVSSSRLGYALLNQADVCELRGAVSDGISAADAAIQELRAKGQSVELAYALIIRSRLRSQAADANGASDDLSEADSLAGASGSDDQKQRIALVRAGLALRAGTWRAALERFEQAREETAHSDAVSLEVPALIGLCRASLELGSLDDAAKRCTEAEKHVRALPHERTEARAIQAEVLLRGRRLAEAERLARRALEESEGRDTPAVGVQAAATLVGIPGLSDRTEVRQRGIGMLGTYLARVGEASRGAVRKRADLVESVERLETSSR